MYAAELRAALERSTSGVGSRELAAATAALVERYRSPRAATEPILSSAVRVAAYAAYRMPATHAAMARVLDVVAGTGFEPRTMLDVGGGTGAATWAAAGAFESLEQVTVLDQVQEALDLGRVLVRGASHAALAGARFERGLVGGLPDVRVDLATVSYVLSELTQGQAADLLDDVMSRARVVALTEPGTPDGHERVLRARERLLAAGWRLLGPCPHELDCPLGARDWCHFSARVNRSAEHRRIKGAELSYEDEKFSWVAAAAPGALAPPEISGRILRHPLKRKGFVEFQVCRPDGTAGREVVSKKAGERYRTARDAVWGDEFPAGQGDSAQRHTEGQSTTP